MLHALRPIGVELLELSNSPRHPERSPVGARFFVCTIVPILKDTFLSTLGLASVPEVPLPMPARFIFLHRHSNPHLWSRPFTEQIGLLQNRTV